MGSACGYSKDRKSCYTYKLKSHALGCRAEQPALRLEGCLVLCVEHVGDVGCRTDELLMVKVEWTSGEGGM
jgi:hypothetical protein